MPASIWRNAAPLVAETIRRLGRLDILVNNAPVVAFLASDEAGWITGETIHVNGGQRG